MVERLSKEVLVPFRSSGFDAMGPPTVELQATVKQIKKLIPTAIKKQVSEACFKSVKTDVYTVSDWPDHKLAASFSRGMHPVVLNSFLPVVVKVSAEYDAENILSHHGQDPEIISAENLANLDLDRVLSLGLAQLIFAACIARPGTFSTANATDSSISFESGDGCLNVSNECNWPPISNIKVEKVYRWLFKVEGFMDGFGQSSLGRALAAFSYATSSYGRKTDMLWPLIGLEALYCREREALSRQILEKSELYLGPRRDFKSKFKSLYEVRSQFIHGAMDFPFSFCPYDAAPEYENSYVKIYAAQDVGTAILIATFQKLVLEGRWDLEFGYYRLSEKNL